MKHLERIQVHAQQKKLKTEGNKIRDHKKIKTEKKRERDYKIALESCL